MNRQDEHFLKIKQIYPDVSAVYKPITPGCVRDVYIVENKTKKFVCRFSDSVTATHNLKISISLTAHGIPAPKVKVFAFDGAWCETYPFIEGKTLHERLLEGIKNDQLDNIYRQLLNISYKISEIPYDKTFDVPLPFPSKILRKIFAKLNPSSPKLIHGDLHAKNVVLDEKDNVRAILDLDAIYPESLSVANMIIMKDAQTYGYDIQKFTKFDTYCDVNKIAKQLKTFSIAAKVYQTLFPNFVRKQILNIRAK